MGIWETASDGCCLINMTTVLISALAFVVAIGILVAVHEYGHYIVARLCGVKVIRYSIGFGKPLLTWRGKDPDQTEYCLTRFLWAAT